MNSWDLGIKPVARILHDEEICVSDMCHDFNSRRFPTTWYVQPAKAQTSLRIRAVWSEPLLAGWIFYDCSATDWTTFSVSKLNKGLYRLVGVYSYQIATLLEITCHGSYVSWLQQQNVLALKIHHTSQKAQTAQMILTALQKMV